MSGVEIATVALRLFPLLLKGANELVPIFDGSKDWWSFEEAYFNFISTIETESLFYRQYLKILLQPLDLDLEENGLMHENADSPLWYDPNIGVKIRRHIGEDNYRWFLEQIEVMNATLEALFRMLPKSGGKLRTLDAGTIEYELKRLEISFSKDKQLLLDKLKSTNTSISTFVRNESFISRPTSSAQIRFARKLQSQASTLYQALQTHLKCSGSKHVHSCEITARWSESSAEPATPSLQLLLGDQTSRRQLSCEVDRNPPPPPKLEDKARHVHKQLSAHERDLRTRQWRAKLVEAGDQYDIGLLSVAATSAILHPAGTMTEKLWKKRETAKLEKGKIRAFQPKRSRHLRENEVPNMERNPPQQPSLHVSAKVTTVAPGSERHVRFAGAIPSDSAKAQIAPDSVAILDLCSFLHGTSDGSKTQHLEVDRNRLLFRSDPLDQSALKNSILHTQLAELTSGLTRLPDRLRLGIQIARTILSFGMSGWIQFGWGRQSVSVLESHSMNGITSTTTYFSCRSLAVTVTEPPPDDKERHTEAVLRSLGIILLELTDRTVLEETPYWGKYCSNGQANEYTPLCAASDWQKKIAETQSDDLADPIKRCLYGKFNKPANLRDPEFLKEVFDGVVSPLENFITGWKTAAR